MKAWIERVIARTVQRIPRRNLPADREITPEKTEPVVKPMERMILVALVAIACIAATYALKTCADEPIFPQGEISR